MDIDKRKQRQAEYIQQHTISPADFKKMIAEKMARAQVYSKALEKREVPREVR